MGRRTAGKSRYRHTLVAPLPGGPRGSRWRAGLEFAPMERVDTGFGGVVIWRSTAIDDFGRHAWRVLPASQEIREYPYE